MRQKGPGRAMQRKLIDSAPRAGHDRCRPGLMKPKVDDMAQPHAREVSFGHFLACCVCMAHDDPAAVSQLTRMALPWAPP